MDTVKFVVIILLLQCIKGPHINSNNKKAGQTNRGSVDPSWAKVRKTNETVLIERLRTAFPYGLDDKRKVSNTADIIILKLSIPRSNQYIRVIKHLTVHQLSGQEFLFNPLSASVLQINSLVSI